MPIPVAAARSRTEVASYPRVQNCRTVCSRTAVSSNVRGRPNFISTKLQHLLQNHYRAFGFRHFVCVREEADMPLRAIGDGLPLRTSNAPLPFLSGLPMAKPIIWNDLQNRWFQNICIHS